MKMGTKTFICGALLLCAPPGAWAQESNSIGNPQLRDFRLTPSGPQPERAQPAPPPVVVAPPPATSANQARPAPARPVERPAAAPAREPVRAETQPQAQPPQQAPAVETAPQPQAPVVSEPIPAAPAPDAATPEGPGEGFPWLYAIPAGAALLLALALLLRRRRRSALIAEAAAEEIAPPAPVPAPPPPEPLARPWLELRLKAEKAAATLDETVVHFELEIENSGESAARNLRIDVKMFNAGQEQDREIGAFFRTAGRESTKLNLPGIAPGQIGAIRGEVAMPRDEMRAVVLENKYLFIPMIAVNALYDWGEGQTGQTSKSYVVGRELEQNEKMGAFRVDLGPRIWKTVGQRPHTLAKRV
jgi:MYXO-CTERM domain-containing protein